MDEAKIKATRIVQKEKNAFQQVDVDICVVGAGISGVSAALEAAKAGHKVAIVDGSPTLGGQAINSIIGTFAGLVSSGPNPYVFTYGMAEQILNDLGAQGNVVLRTRFNTVMYDEIVLSRWIEKSIHQAGIMVLTGAVLRDVTVQNRRITSIDLATRFGDVKLSANGFVDSSGDAALTWFAGLPCREPAEGEVYGSQVAVLEGINEENYPTHQELEKRLKEKADEYGFERTDGLAVLFPGRGTAILNMTHVETPLEPVAAAQKALEGKDQSDNTLVFLQKEFPEAFGNSRVRSYGFPGVRQTRWIKGRSQLTVEDIREGKKFHDAIARTAWPVELHNTKDGYIWETLGDEDHVHYIPLSCMTPPDVDNLVAAGRCIDGDVVALSSVRVMGPGIATGAAAAHALSLAGKDSVHEINIDTLQQRIRDNLTRKEPVKKYIHKVIEPTQ